MSRTALWSTVGALALLVLLLTWFLLSFDRVQTTERTGFSAEARRDSLLAAKRMLGRMGIAAGELGPGEWRTALGTARGTLVLLSHSWTLGNEARDALLDWVAGGGRLVVASRSRVRAGAQDGQLPTLVRWLGIEALPPEGAEPAALRDAVTRVTLAQATIAAEFGTELRLRVVGDTAYATLGEDEHGACVLQRPLGRGRVTVLCGAQPLDNRSIGDAGNATLLWWLAGGEEQAPAPLWFVRDTDMPALWQWLWARIPQSLVAAVLALAAGLWSTMRRSGPLHDLRPPARRRTLEHIEASGRFAWRHHGGIPLLEAMRHAFHAALEQRHPGWARLQRAERVQRLARAAGLDPESVYRATEASPDPKDRLTRTEFVVAVRHLQQIWRSL